ncbi:MAG: nitroreductase family deazaflavin-dependent oxidoreductase [Acidobacteria bacterium]|nr:MAG: nitroreductase family deazaflavin-dependent oxidoreductase [Acidobacteriota bacterium]REK03816.1 MAG: nitroreductase family deazaflavin-dependent oxidoreductase [Acidobacteriota bacterium]
MSPELPHPPIDRNLPQWIQDHLALYHEKPEEGHLWNGVPTLLLTTVGRKSKQRRQLPLIYAEDDGRYVIVASKGGAPEHPAWYLNLQDDPNVVVQVAGDRFQATARTVDSRERARLWPKMVEIWPQYDDYQEKTDREIPIVVLDRAGRAG